MRIMLEIKTLGQGLDWAYQEHVKLSLTESQIRDLAWIYSPMQAKFEGKPPFRAPHHSINQAYLLGQIRRAYGKSAHFPGEVSMAHGGTLYLHDLLEFRYSSIVLLGKALDNGFSSVGWPTTKIPASPQNLIVSIGSCLCSRSICGCTDKHKETYDRLRTDYAKALSITTVTAL